MRHCVKVRKLARIRNQYNQPHWSQDTNGKVTAQFNITIESQEVSPFLAGDNKAAINRCEIITDRGHK